MLTFQELISTPFFSETSIIGGCKGKERSFSNLADDFTNLKQPSLILLKGEENDIEAMIEHIHSPNVQGFLVYGTSNIPFPLSFIEKLNSEEKPVLQIKEGNKHAIKKQIEDMFALKSSGHFHYVWNGMTDYWINFIHEHSLQKMIERLRLFIHNELYLLNKDFSLYFDHNEELTRNELKTIQTLYLQEKKLNVSWYMLQSEQDYFLLFPLKTSNEIYGYIVLKEQPGMMIDTCMEIISRAIPAVITALKTENAVLSAHKEYIDHFLYNLLYNNIESEQALIQLGKQWDIDFTKPAQLMVVKLKKRDDLTLKNNERDLCIGIIRSIAASHFLKTITHEMQGNVIVIVFDPTVRKDIERKKFITVLAKNIVKEIKQANPSVSCQIGIGRFYRSNMKLYKSFHEGKIAIELGKYELNQQDVWHFEDIGIAKLLAHIQNDILHEYYKEVLGELIHLEQEKEDYYLETLQEYFRNNGDINKTAHELFVHPNTLRKRMKKIESVLNCDLSQMDDQLKVLVALKIMNMLR